MEEEIEGKAKSDPVCPRCGLRSYDSECAQCGTPIVDKKDDEEEEYDWREHKR
jgi:ribosomal protein L37E